MITLLLYVHVIKMLVYSKGHAKNNLHPKAYVI